MFSTQYLITVLSLNLLVPSSDLVGFCFPIISVLPNCPPQGGSHMSKCDVLLTETENEMNTQKYQSFGEKLYCRNSSRHPVSYQRSHAGHVGVLYGLLLLEIVVSVSDFRRCIFFFRLASSRGSET